MVSRDITLGGSLHPIVRQAHDDRMRVSSPHGHSELEPALSEVEREESGVMGLRATRYRPNRLVGKAPIPRFRAFTLLEIMLAVAILGMMAMAIYRFVQT